MISISSWSVARRLAAAFGFVTVLSVTGTVAGGWALENSNASMSTMHVDRAVPLHQLGEVQYLITHSRLVLTDAVLSESPEAAARRLRQHEEAWARIDTVWKAYAATQMTAEETELIKRFLAAQTQFRQQGIEPLAKAVASADWATARTLASGAVSQLNPAMVDALAALMQLQVDVAEAEFQSAQTANRRAEWLLAGLLLVIVGSGVGIAKGLSRQLSRSLGAEPAELAAVAARIAEGQLADDGRGAAPAGSVMASMQAMRQSLVRLVASVRQGVDSVATASAQIAQGNLDLSGRTEQQASSLQETAASMEELTGTVASGADNARQANQLAQGASATAVHGGEVVAQVVQTMGGIQSSSRRIADITAVIDSIAFQTNILALNAAVEAARAGEQGRGFAVVASEVRSLAQRSAGAAREIRQLIEDSTSQVEAGSQLVEQAGTTMSEVVAQVRRVTDLIGEITAASVEQSQGIAQVGQAVTLLDQATQQNAALVEESAAAAASLRQQAERLAASVAAFRLEAA